MYSADVLSRFGEPTRLSSDRSLGDGNPVSVRLLHEAQTPGSYRRSEDRTRSFIDRGIITKRGNSFAIYTISRPDRPDMCGIVGVLHLEEATVYPHEDVIPSAVATRLADIERAGAFLEPVVVATEGLDMSTVEGDAESIRSARYGDELHSVSTIAQDQLVQPLAPSEGAYVTLDGHHRIAAVMRHASHRESKASILAMVVDSGSPGLFVEPQHRVLSGPPIRTAAVPSNASVMPYHRSDPVSPGSVAIVSADLSVVISMPDASTPQEGRISALTLDRYLLSPLSQRVEGYATRERDAYDQLEAGANAVAIMGDLRIADVSATARSGIVLPEKTTCFNPKVAVGLVGSLLRERPS